MRELDEIRAFMDENSCEDAKKSWMKSVPGSERIHGVYLSEVNRIVSKYTGGGFQLVDELWNSGYLEERILVAKILGKIGKKDPDKALEMVKNFADDVSNWAVCDTLSTQGVRSIAKRKQREILELSRELVISENPWKRRSGIVLLLNFKKDESLRKELEEVIASVEGDDEYYVKKAVEWIKRSLK